MAAACNYGGSICGPIRHSFCGQGLKLRTCLSTTCKGLIRQCLEPVRYMLPAALEYPSGIEMVSVCTGLLGKEGRVNISVDTRL